jgi:hypothetical protein
MRIPSRSLLVTVSLVLISCAGGAPPPEPLPPPPPPFVALRELDTPPPMTGETVEGRAGDWILRNERLAVVVAGTGTHRAPTIGNLIDAAPAGGGDALRGIFTGLGDSLLLPVRYRSVQTATAPDSSLQVLVASGDWTAPAAPPDSLGASGEETPATPVRNAGATSGGSVLRVETRYELRAGSDFLTVRTTLVNEGLETLTALALGDVVEWGRAEPYAPGRGILTGAAPGPLPFAAASGEGSGYAWVSTAGDFAGRHGRGWSDLAAESTGLAPGDTASYERLLFVVRGSTARAQVLAWAAKGRPVGKLRAEVEGDDGRPVPGAVVEAVDGKGVSRGLGETDTRGRVTLALPPGRYRLTARHPRRGPAERARDARVVAGRDAHVGFKLPAAATVTLVSVDAEGRPSPATWIFTGIEGTPDPDLGPGWRADGAGRALFSATGAIRAGIPAGRYRVTAARGPAYEPWETEATFHAGREAALQAVLIPLDLPPGWAVMDAGVQAAPSPGTEVAPADCVRVLVSRGIGWFASIDRDRVTDYAPVIDGLTLSAPLHCLPGMERWLESSSPIAAYPIPAGAALREGESFPPGITTPSSGRGRAVIQLDPADVRYGGIYARSRPVVPDTVWKRRWGAIELLGPGEPESFESRWDRWLSLLGGGRSVTAMGGTGAARLSEELPWGPRSYVFTGTGPATADSVVDAIHRGRVVVTDGPMIDLRLGGTTIGDTLVTTPGAVKGHLRVWAPSPVEVGRVTVIVNGKADAIFMARGRDRSIRFDEDIEPMLVEPGYVLVRVDGVFHSNSPRGGTGPSEHRSSRKSIAFSNPIWVEILRGGS